MLPSAISVSAHTVTDHLASMAAASSELPSADRISETHGGDTGLSTGIGSALQFAGRRLETKLSDLTRLIESGSDAMRASVVALTEADAISADEAREVSGLIGDDTATGTPSSASGSI